MKNTKTSTNTSQSALEDDFIMVELVSSFPTYITILRKCKMNDFSYKILCIYLLFEAEFPVLFCDTMP